MAAQQEDPAMVTCSIEQIYNPRVDMQYPFLKDTDIAAFRARSRTGHAGYSDVEVADGIFKYELGQVLMCRFDQLDERLELLGHQVVRWVMAQVPLFSDYCMRLFALYSSKTTRTPWTEESPVPEDTREFRVFCLLIYCPEVFFFFHQICRALIQDTPLTSKLVTETCLAMEKKLVASVQQTKQEDAAAGEPKCDKEGDDGGEEGDEEEDDGDESGDGEEDDGDESGDGEEDDGDESGDEDEDDGDKGGDDDEDDGGEEEDGDEEEKEAGGGSPLVFPCAATFGDAFYIGEEDEEEGESAGAAGEEEGEGQPVVWEFFGDVTDDEADACSVVADRGDDAEDPLGSLE